MKVLIVGAGMQGQVLTWNLGRNPAVTEIVVADYDEARAAVRRRPGRQRQGAGDLHRRLRRDAVAKAAEGAKLVVNAVVPTFNMAILHACLKAGAELPRHGLRARRPPRPSTRPGSSSRRSTPSSPRPGLTALQSSRHGPGRHQHLRRQRLRRPRQVLRDPHQGLRPVRLAGAAAGVVAGDLLHRLRPAAAALRGRRVQARRDLRPQGVLPVPRALRPGALHLPRPRRGHHAAAPAAQEVRRQGPALRRLQDGHRRGGASTPTPPSSAPA